ncbi:diuretic hormone receptor-like [Chrysoperla carnea]|uniref:diuretic hormone receptor-like n=1 Tax=Chrysoperla carnea TaxID=189513 RepID=UPI001D06D75B|nr:diuretic hormone receptor-like [Chrysoperla carnea]XP_044731853.1 diuretic hormone receptor-like [Chrysoperla carnea]
MGSSNHVGTSSTRLGATPMPITTSSAVSTLFHYNSNSHHHRHFRSDDEVPPVIQSTNTPAEMVVAPPHEDLEEILKNIPFDDLFRKNGSEIFSKEMECHMQAIHHESLQQSQQLQECPPYWDSLLCWPATTINTSSIQPCFSEFNGIKYDVTKNASKWCHLNGTWDRYTNYSSCNDVIRNANNDNQEFDPGIELTSYIYFIGYTISLLALTIAIAIFLYFKDLKCLRNTIHTNLMFAYILADFMWILTVILQFNVQTDLAWCVILIILLHYFHLTNFFWMFVEGLYLYMLVVETFYTENMKLKVYAAIGWGGPVLFVAAWATAKFTVPKEIIANATSFDNIYTLKHCPWMTPHSYDWIYQAPALIVLAANLIFLLMIMWVLITKLRSANNVETQQYRKATKALVVLIPLLGTTYILVISGPTEGVSRNIYDALRAILLSTQGFLVALFYCFLNTEVQNTLRHYIGRWKETRSLKGGRRNRYYSKDWSPRSHTESIRLCINPPTKRESTASETTTTTLLGNSANNSGRVSNGSGTRTYLQPNDESLGE